MMTAAGLTKINAVTKPATGAGTDVEVTLTYTATVNENAIVDIPEKNNISLDYGNTPGQDIVEQPVTPVNNQLNVTKTWSTGTVPEGVNVVYTLSDGTNSYPVFLTNTTTGTIDLGNGVTFTVTGPFSGTFSGEALATGTWTISERISGYAPAYTGGTDGNVTINNVKDDDNPEPLNPTEPEVVNGGEKFLKVDGVTKSPLAGAEFVVKNNRVNDPDNGKFLALKDATTQADEVAAYQAAEAAYQAAVAAATTDAPDTENIAALKATRDATYEAMNMQWTWVAAEADGFKFISAQDGTFEVTGLAYGAYQLIETKPPTGYAENRTPRDFTVGLGTYADETVITIENNKVTIPQTGGIGTIIFVIAGLAIMGTAVIVMKKRQELDV